MNAKYYERLWQEVEPFLPAEGEGYQISVLTGEDGAMGGIRERQNREQKNLKSYSNECNPDDSEVIKEWSGNTPWYRNILGRAHCKIGYKSFSEARFTQLTTYNQ